MIPIAVIRNGRGPTALLTGANHGDEYEGPIALADLAPHADRRTKCTGRVIIVPFMNYPAFRAGAPPLADRRRQHEPPLSRAGRTAPSRRRSPTSSSARSCRWPTSCSTSIPAAARSISFRSPPAMRWRTRRRRRAAIAARDAFAAPYSMTMLEIDAGGMYDTAAEALGKVFVTTEIGGGGTATARTVAIAKRGVRNVLKHAGILAGEVERLSLDRARNAECRLLHLQPVGGLDRACRRSWREQYAKAIFWHASIGSIISEQSPTSTAPSSKAFLPRAIFRVLSASATAWRSWLFEHDTAERVSVHFWREADLPTTLIDVRSSG